MADEYHGELQRVSDSYRQYAAEKVAGWSNAGYCPTKVRLGTANDYAAHYEKHLLPILREFYRSKQDNKTSDSSVSGSSVKKRQFLDLGSAPGGLCAALLHRWDVENESWSGTGITLKPGKDSGGLAMEISASARLTIRFADVAESEAFVKTALQQQQRESALDAYDFVNAGIVLDARVKSARGTCAVGYGPQLVTQLRVAVDALRSDGTGVLMVVLKIGHTLLPELFPTLAILARCCDTLRVIPTMYTETNAKKQLYAIALGCKKELFTISTCHEIEHVWQQGKERYREFAKAGAESKKAREAQTSDNNNNKDSISNENHVIDKKNVSLTTTMTSADSPSSSSATTAHNASSSSVTSTNTATKESVDGGLSSCSDTTKQDTASLTSSPHNNNNNNTSDNSGSPTKRGRSDTGPTVQLPDAATTTATSFFNGFNPKETVETVYKSGAGPDLDAFFQASRNGLATQFAA